MIQTKKETGKGPRETAPWPPLIAGESCAGPGDGLHDPCGSLPTQNPRGFYELRIYNRELKAQTVLPVLPP